MDVRCDQCGTEYEFSQNRIGPKGVTVKCTACQHVFRVHRPRTPIGRETTTIGRGPEGREWRVRQADGHEIAFRELTTLQKWIVEGRIKRDDQISKNAKTWKRLGNILELEPFFRVYEQAQSNLESRTVPDHHSTLPPPAEGYPHPLAASSDIAPTRPPRPEPTGPTPGLRLPSSAPAEPSLPSRSGLRPPPAEGTASHQLPANGAFLAQPAGLPSSAPGTNPPPPLGVPIQDDDEHQDVIERFRRDTRRRHGLTVLGLTALIALAVTVAYGVYGPANNPVRALAQRAGLLRAVGVDDEAGELVTQAMALVDRDAEEDLRKSLVHLGKARAKRPSDVTLLAHQARVRAYLADSQARYAERLNREATLTAGPKSPEELRREAAEYKVFHSRNLRHAEEEATRALGVAPRDPWVRAAAAAVYLASPRPNAAQPFLAPSSTQAPDPDPALIAIRAHLAAWAHERDGKPEEALKSVRKARQARPSWTRPKVLAARLEAQLGRTGIALATLERILSQTPDHAEAKVLWTQVKRDAGSRSSTPRTAPAAGPNPTNVHTPPTEREAPDRAPADRKPEPAPTIQGTSVEPVREKSAREEAPASGEDAPNQEEATARTYTYWMALGDRHREHDRPQEALNAYDQAASINPTEAEVHVGKGWSFLDLHRPQLALLAFKKALEANDRYAEAYYGLGEVHRALGNRNEAIEYLERYLKNGGTQGAERVAVERHLEALRRQ